tara:strand:- start:239 stop:385 length:147 start_codon:yes stop_codon:yes gene_type:complete
MNNMVNICGVYIMNGYSSVEPEYNQTVQNGPIAIIQFIKGNKDANECV